MKEKASLFRHLFLTKNFILMLVMLVVIIITITAWFTVHKTVEASRMMVKADSSEIDIAPAIKKYDNNWNLVSDGPGEFGSKITFTAPADFGSFIKDCTGDGEELIVPDFNITRDYDSVRRTTGKDVNVNVAGSSARSQEYSRIEQKKHPEDDAPPYQYLEFEFYVRSKSPMLRLAAESELVAETEADGYSLSTVSYTKDGGTVDKRSAYSTGNSVIHPVNVDGLVGAIRVSLLGEACSNVSQSWYPTSGTAGALNTSSNPPNTVSRSDMVKQILWYPRPDVMLSIPETANDITNWNLNTGLTTGDSFFNSYYKNNGTEGLTYVSHDQDSKTVVSPGVGSGHPTLGASYNISDFSSTTYNWQPVSLVVDKANYHEEAMYYVTKYTLRVWIEGTDSEARRAMDGGKFNLTLKFM